MKAQNIPTPSKQLSIQSAYIPPDRHLVDLEWFDWMIETYNVTVGDRNKFLPFPEDEHGNIIIPSN